MNEFRRHNPFRAAYISVQEGWYHLIAVLVFIPMANYLLIGIDYFRDSRLFVQATLLVTALYIPIAVALTLAVRYAINRYPSIRQTNQRLLFKLTLTSLLTSPYAVGATWLLSRLPHFMISFSWVNMRSLVGLGLLFDLLFCLAHGYFYIRTKWHEDQIENEQLKKQTIQHQLDALKTQISPHFLFNSLNSLSSLITEDSEQAERFVDEMAKVYRYLLQANNRELISLETELSFTNSYTYLLKTRYGKGISVTIDADIVHQTYYLPPLSLQTLLENALKHNAVLASRPLLIEIRLTENAQLMVRNTIQKRPVRVESGGVGLSTIVAKYALLGEQEITIQHTDSHFTVWLPLLSGQQLMMES